MTVDVVERFYSKQTELYWMFKMKLFMFAFHRWAALSRG